MSAGLPQVIGGGQGGDLGFGPAQHPRLHEVHGFQQRLPERLFRNDNHHVRAIHAGGSIDDVFTVRRVRECAFNTKNRTHIRPLYKYSTSIVPCSPGGCDNAPRLTCAYSGNPALTHVSRESRPRERSATSSTFVLVGLDRFRPITNRPRSNSRTRTQGVAPCRRPTKSPPTPAGRARPFSQVLQRRGWTRAEARHDKQSRCSLGLVRAMAADGRMGGPSPSRCRARPAGTPSLVSTSPEFTSDPARPVSASGGAGKGVGHG